MITLRNGKQLTDSLINLYVTQSYQRARDKNRARNIGTYSSFDYSLSDRELAGTITTTTGHQIPLQILIAYK